MCKKKQETAELQRGLLNIFRLKKKCVFSKRNIKIKQVRRKYISISVNNFLPTLVMGNGAT